MKDPDYYIEDPRFLGVELSPQLVLDIVVHDTGNFKVAIPIRGG